jgi:quinoprotein glucose dehydrogenase
MGGSVATAGGLVFIAATTDSKFRAFDSRTGKELWVTTLDATGDAAPMVYQGRDGKQYVVIATGGTNRFRMLAKTADETSDSLVAFALPSGETPINQTPITRSRRPRPQIAISDADFKATGPPLPEGEGKEVVARICTKCHGAAVFSKLRMGRDGWEDEVAAMVEKGAAGSDVEMRTVVTYLSKYFGRNSGQ